jgi:DNA-directed RNA polymerase I subunit RPA43
MSSAAVAVGTKRRFSDVEPIISNENDDSSSKKIQKQEQISTVSLIDKETGLSQCFHRVRAKLYLSLAPCHLEQPIAGLRQQHLDPLIMMYNSTLDGVIISYSNVKLADAKTDATGSSGDVDVDVEYKYVAKVSDENPFSFLWVYVDFVVWQPKIGDVLEGYSVMQSQGHIGVLVHDVFNASIKKFYIPQDWYFVPNQADEETSGTINADADGESGTNTGDANNGSGTTFKSLGHWCDADGVAVGGKIKFTVRALHVTGKGLAVEGTLLTPGMERDSQPVVMEQSIKDSIKKHVKFDGEVDGEVAGADVVDVVVDDIEASELPEIAPVKVSDDDEDAAPKYQDSDSDSDNDSDSAKTKSTSSSDSGSDSSDSSDSDSKEEGSDSE